MKNSFKHFLTTTAILLVVACGSSKELTQALNNNDPDEGPKARYELANELYEKGDYYKAIQLYEVIINERILVDDLAEIYFKYANCHFAQFDYETASTLYNGFYVSYPDDENAEQAYFTRAICSYEMADGDFRLDQTNLVKAMDEFADYLITYPDGEFAEEAQNRMDEIRFSIEQKELDNGNLYLKIGEYKAAIEEYNRFIEDFPSSELVENAYYGMLESRYLLAKNSIEEKQQDRFKRVFSDHEFFIDRYPESTFLNEANEINEQALKDYEKLYSNEQANN
ncbi:MAG: outer membrane protein assembly factor BamD [Saprospiraceae bacterium]|nr:outer membrane protein assembly factor BamD [Saprospiraceae bacterium]